MRKKSKKQSDTKKKSERRVLTRVQEPLPFHFFAISASFLQPCGLFVELHYLSGNNNFFFSLITTPNSTSSFHFDHYFVFFVFLGG
jgi:hypothetical protein